MDTHWIVKISMFFVGQTIHLPSSNFFTPHGLGKVILKRSKRIAKLQNFDQRNARVLYLTDRMKYLEVRKKVVSNTPS